MVLHILICLCKFRPCMVRKRPYVTVTLPPEIVEYLQSKIDSRDFANMSHGIELCVLRFKQAEERGERP